MSLRVNFVLPEASTAGGVRAVAEYAGRLAARGHRVVVCSQPHKQPPLKSKIKSVLTGRGWPAGKSGPGHLDQVPGIEHRVLDRRRPVVDSDLPDADVTVATWWETAEWVHALSPTKGAKVHFVQHHEVVFDNQPVARVEAALRLEMPKIVCARWLADVLRDLYDQPDAVHISYGLDMSLFDAPPRDKQRYPTIGMMYSTAHFKGCDVSIAAVAQASKMIPNLRLLAFGHRDPTPSLPLPPGTEFHRQPPQKKIAEIYASCDAWLFGSRCEGYGMPILEAMACRTPVIGTPTGAAPELIGEGGGILVKMQDPHDMAVAIERICRMSNVEWRALSEAAYRIPKKYTWERATSQFEQTLARFAGKSS